MESNSNCHKKYFKSLHPAKKETVSEKAPTRGLPWRKTPSFFTVQKGRFLWKIMVFTASSLRVDAQPKALKYGLGAGQSQPFAPQDIVPRTV